MTVLSEHFTLEEATLSQEASRRGIDNTPTDWQIANATSAAWSLEKVREILGHSMHIDSWIRCLPLNRALGSADTSPHVDGFAIDFICPAFGTPQEICKALIASQCRFDKLIFEGAWVHISFDPRMRRECYTAVFAAGAPTEYTRGIA